MLLLEMEGVGNNTITVNFSKAVSSTQSNKEAYATEELNCLMFKLEGKKLQKKNRFG